MLPSRQLSTTKFGTVLSLLLGKYEFLVENKIFLSVKYDFWVFKVGRSAYTILIIVAPKRYQVPKGEPSNHFILYERDKKLS